MEKNEFPSQEVIDLIRSCKIEEAFRITATYIHLSAEARTILCQLLRSSHNIFLLSGYKDYIKQLADKGNPWMQYAWARFNDGTAPGPDSVTIAQEYYNKAVEAGISDARMCLAYMWRDGYAAYRLGHAYYYGEYGFEQDYAEAFRWFSRGAILRSAISANIIWEITVLNIISHSE